MSDPKDLTAEGAENAEERNQDFLFRELCDNDSLEVKLEVRAELERRVALADADLDRGVPWEIVRAAARARWPQ